MKKSLLIILILVNALLTNQCNGITIFVDDDAPDCGGGQSWQNAYKYLQDALSDAQPGYQIWVAEGTYRPDCNCTNPNGTGDRTATFQLKYGVSVYGGFAGFGAPDPNFRDPNLYDKTILSGDLYGNDVDVNDPCDLLNEPTRAENSYHVVTRINALSTTILDGFIITGGNANGSTTNADGGGIYKTGSITILNCTFAKNSSTSGGGAMYNISTSPNLTNCTFTENSAEFGGAIYNYSCSPTFTGCEFSKNHAGLGGAIYTYYNGNPQLTNCELSRNQAVDEGGAIYNDYSWLTLNNCTCTENQANRGGVIYNANSISNLTNCTFNKNKARYSGGAVYHQYGYTILTNCILWLDTPDEIREDTIIKSTVTYSDIKGGWPGMGNIDEDPCFIKPSYWTDANDPNIIVEPNDPNAIWMEGNYNLLANSPCIDAGDSSAVPFGIWTDLDGEPRFVDDPDRDDSGVGIPPIVDMGAHEFQDDVFKGMECFPQTYSTYRDWVTLGKPDCWCGMYVPPPRQKCPYQCDGDACCDDSGAPYHYRVFTCDLGKIVSNWKKKINDPTLDPCADIDHKSSGAPYYYRVFSGDLGKIITNWKKKDAQLPDHCPRPE